MSHRVPVVLQMTLSDCGAACLAAVLRHHGRYTTAMEARDRTGAGRDGVTARQIATAGRSYGLTARGYRCEAIALDELALPAIAHWDDVHFVVVERVGPRRVEVMDPALGRRSLGRDEFEAGFGRVVVALEPGPDFVRRDRGPRGPLLPDVVRTAVAGSRGLLAAALALSFLLQVLGLALPAATALLIDRVVGARDPGPLPALGAGIAAVVLTHLLLAQARTAVLVAVQRRVDGAVMRGVLGHLLALPLSFFQQRSGGDLMTRVASTAVIRQLVTTEVVAAVLDAAFAAVYLVLLLVTDRTLGLVACALGAVQVAVLLGTRQRARRIRQQHLLAQSKSQSLLFGALAGIATVKATGSEERVLQAWSDRFATENGLHAREIRLDASVDDVSGTLRVLAPLALVWAGAHLILDGTLSLGTTVALQALAVAFLLPLSGLIGNLQRLQLAGAHLERLRDVLDAAPGPSREARPPVRPSGRIELRSVGFRYAPAAPPVLRDVSATIEPGQKVAVVGASGSGKSTLGLLLLGLLAPDRGDVRVDGIPAAEIGRGQFGVVLQDPFVFGESIRDNIAGNAPDLPIEVVVRAARIACIDEDIARMPMGYATQLGDGGAGLSGGQRQRLALARAVACDPPVLLLDEATSHLDTLTEQRIEANLDALRCTRIVIAHRIGTVRNADLILVLDRGEIVERGRHDELVARGGHYAALAHTIPDQVSGTAAARERASRRDQPAIPSSPNAAAAAAANGAAAS